MSSDIPSNWIGRSPASAETAGRELNLHVTPTRVTATVVVLIASFLASVGIERLGVHVPVVRPVLAFLVLAVVPGYLLLGLAGVTPWSTSETVVYVVGLGLAGTMAIGTILNFGLQPLIARPLSELPAVLGVSAFLLGLTWLYARRVNDVTVLSLNPAELTSPLVLGLALLPFLGIYGALVLTRFGSNLLLLPLYAIIALLPVLVLLGHIPDRLFPYVLWIVSISLLLQNTLTGQFLAWGDQSKEASLALSVLRTGYWDPALAPGFGGKFTMLRIVILHPLYGLFTGLKLVWVFKLAHPLLFSVMPVALYQAYRRFVDERAAFLSAFLYVSLFSFFVVLSRNTRTATALLFLSLIALLVTDRSIPLFRRKLLTIVFAAGIVVSHYGVSYMVLFALAAVYPLVWFLDWVTGRTTKPITSWSFTLLYVTITLAWYIFASPSAKAFSLVVGFGRTFVDKLLQEFLLAPGSASATTRYVTTNFSSITIDILRYYNIVVGAFIGIGVLLTFLQLIKNTDSDTFDNEYLAYAAVFLGVFGVTFLPVERFNTARTYATTLVFFAPFFVIGIEEAYSRLAGGDLLSLSIPVRRITTVAVVLYFALNVGLVSTTVTNEYAPNALVEKERIMDDGHPAEKAYFYKQYPTVYGVESTHWLQRNGENNTTVYQSGWPGGFKGAVGHEPINQPDRKSLVFRKQQMTRELFESGEQLGHGYVYLSAYNWIGNVIRTPSGHFEYDYLYTREVKSNWGGKDRVYDNGGSVVYY